MGGASSTAQRSAGRSRSSRDSLPQGEQEPHRANAEAPQGQIARARAIAENGDFSTARDKSVFYSGPGNRQRAIDSVARGGQPIDATPGGKALNSENLYGENGIASQAEADAIWSRASQRFAEDANGEVTAFIKGGKPDRVFGQTELPALLKNPKVTNINGIPREQLLHMKPSEAFSAVERASP